MHKETTPIDGIDAEQTGLRPWISLRWPEVSLCSHQLCEPARLWGMCSAGSSQPLYYLQGRQIQSSWKDIDDSLPCRGVLKDSQCARTLSHPLVHLQQSQSAGVSYNRTVRTSVPHPCPWNPG